MSLEDNRRYREASAPEREAMDLRAQGLRPELPADMWEAAGDGWYSSKSIECPFWVRETFQTRPAAFAVSRVAFDLVYIETGRVVELGSFDVGPQDAERRTDLLALADKIRRSQS